jgi:ubiquinone/menaquinone biosynthesis C-methylase UbiE
MPFADNRFQLVFGFSVLTHIDAAHQRSWLTEMHRVLSANGILLVTTHGRAYENKLAAAEKKWLEENGIVTQSYPAAGAADAGDLSYGSRFQEND